MTKDPFPTKEIDPILLKAIDWIVLLESQLTQLIFLVHDPLDWEIEVFCWDLAVIRE